MAWAELQPSRTRYGRTYSDLSTPADKRRLCTRVGPIHYESTIDSGVYDAAPALDPERVDNATFDGWRITENGWHWAIGKDIANHGDEDGWVGFGGRHGAHWFKFRLTNLGYLHWPTRELEGIGGAPTYDRANFSQEKMTKAFGPNNDTLDVSCDATWSGLWSTPGGGDVSLKWSARVNGLKEIITINQAARLWIAANAAPSTPGNETWFGFRFELDVSDLPRMYQAGRRQNMNNIDVADDDGPLEGKDGLSRLLFSMPLDYVWVGDDYNDDLSNFLRLRKRIWRQGNKYYLMVGVKVSDLVSLPPGDLHFDPTVNEETTTGTDDAYQSFDTTTTYNDSALTWRVQASVTSTRKVGGVRFQTISIDGGVTIDDAYITIQANSTSFDSIASVIHMEDVDDAATFSSGDGPADRTKTTASTAWTESNMGTSAHDSPSFTSSVQEVVDRGGWASGQDMAVIVVGNNEFGVQARINSYDNSPTLATDLTIDYTSTQDVTPTGIASGEAFGTASITTGAVTVSPSSIPAGEKIGSAVITTGAVTVTPTGIATAEAFGTAVITTGAITVSPTGVSSLEAFGTASLTMGTAIVDPSGIASAEAFGTAVITTGAVTVSPSGIVSLEAFGTAVITTGAVTVSPTGIASLEAFGTAVITTGAVTVSPTGIVSTEAFGTAIVSLTQSVSPSAVASAEAFGTAVITTGAVTVSPTGVASLEAFGTAVITTGAVTVSPTGIVSSEKLGTAVITSVATVAPDGISSLEDLGDHTVSTDQTVSPSAIASAEAIGSHILTVGDITINPDGIASTEAFGSLTVFYDQVITFTGIASEEVFGTHVIFVIEDLELAGTIQAQNATMATLAAASFRVQIDTETGLEWVIVHPLDWTLPSHHLHYSASGGKMDWTLPQEDDP